MKQSLHLQSQNIASCEVHLIQNNSCIYLCEHHYYVKSQHKTKQILTVLHCSIRSQKWQWNKQQCTCQPALLIKDVLTYSA